MISVTQYFMFFFTKWGPWIAKLVSITPITMVYGTYNCSYWGLSTSLYLGGPKKNPLVLFTTYLPLDMNFQNIHRSFILHPMGFVNREIPHLGLCNKSYRIPQDPKNKQLRSDLKFEPTFEIIGYTKNH